MTTTLPRPSIAMRLQALAAAAWVTLTMLTGVANLAADDAASAAVLARIGVSVVTQPA